MIPKKINFLVNTLVGGGAEKQLLLCAKVLAQAGHSVRVFALSPVSEHPRYAPLLTECGRAGVLFVAPRSRLDLLTVLLSLWRHSGFDSILWTWGFRAEALRLVCPRLRRSVGVCSLRDASGKEILRHRRLLTFGLVSTRGYIANTRRAVDLAERQIPGIAAKSHVLYNAVETLPGEMLRLSTGIRPQGRVRVAMLANILIEKKGYDVAVKCAELIRDARLPVNLVIGGAPNEWGALKRLIDAAGVASIISYEGRISDPYAFLGKADAFLLLSRFEGTPNALLEAMTLGLPCAATDVGDVGVFADECPGLRLLPVADAEAAFAVIKAWSESPLVASAEGAVCREYAQRKFSELEMARNLGEIIRTLFARQRGV